MNLVPIYILASTILLVISGIMINGNRWWLSLLVKLPFNLTALVGILLSAKVLGWFS